MIHFLWSDSCMYSLWLSSRIITKLCGGFPEVYAVCDLHSTFCSPKGSPILVLHTETWHFISLCHTFPPSASLSGSGSRRIERKETIGVHPFHLGSQFLQSVRKVLSFRVVGSHGPSMMFLLVPPLAPERLKLECERTEKRTKKEGFQALSDG